MLRWIADEGCVYLHRDADFGLVGKWKRAESVTCKMPKYWWPCQSTLVRSNYVYSLDVMLRVKTTSISYSSKWFQCLHCKIGNRVWKLVNFRKKVTLVSQISGRCWVAIANNEVLDEIHTQTLLPSWGQWMRKGILYLKCVILPPTYNGKSIPTTTTTRTDNKQMLAFPMPVPLLLLQDHITGELLPHTFLYNPWGEFDPRTCFKFKKIRENKVK